MALHSSDIMRAGVEDIGQTFADNASCPSSTAMFFNAFCVIAAIDFTDEGSSDF
ncbi:hypothetical protein [Sphingomonas sp. R86520]|uniref:hypothetical protein n=1 Tax=Sphingomonas sp. R86520 TaxID=3093859 RepID=UPI0036D3784B